MRRDQKCGIAFFFADVKKFSSKIAGVTFCSLASEVNFGGEKLRG